MPVHTPPEHPLLPNPLDWLLANCQASGAVLVHPEPAGHRTPGDHAAHSGACFRIEPYFASMGLLWAHRASPDALQAPVRRWLVWWFEHRHARTGTPLIQYQTASGEPLGSRVPDSDLPPDHEDATDSNVALWYLLLAAHLAHGGPAALQALPPDLRHRLHEPLLALFELQDTDGLTWAKQDYRIKYLMDNAEVCAGLRAAHWVLTHFGGHSLHQHLQGWVADWFTQALTALQGLYLPQIGWWATQQNAMPPPNAPDLSVAYPDFNAQVWPFLFDLDPKRGPRLFQQLEALQPRWWQSRFSPDTTADVHMALAAKLAGHEAHVQHWLRHVAPSFVQAAQDSETGTASFRWPFTSAEAGMLHLLQQPPLTP